MIDEEIEEFGTHDPDDVAARNVEIGGLLRRVAGVYASATVALDSSNTDAALVITTVAYDAVTQKLSWRQSGGTTTNQALSGDGVTMRAGYRIVIRITLADGRHYDQSVFQPIFHH